MTMFREFLSYNVETGVFRWIKEANARAKVGCIAGTKVDGGYIRIQLGRSSVRAHRLAWWFVYGEWPAGVLDHIDGNPANNAIANLRSATHRENQRNTRAHRDSRSGFKGVGWHPQRAKWAAKIMVDRQSIYLGLFDKPEDAARAYDAAAKQHHGKFARLNFPTE